MRKGFEGEIKNMSVSSKVEQGFTIIDQSSTYISQELHKSYLEALIDTTEHLFEKSIVVELTDEQYNHLNQLYQSFEAEEYTSEELRRAFQLASLKGIKEQSITGTGITPDTVAMFIGYMAKKLVKPTTIFDPAVGSGNLLTCVMNQYEQGIQGVGTEVDPTLVRLAYVNANLQHHQVELFHQDGLKPIYIPLPQLTICDLPIGVYPNQKVAQKYKLYQEDQETYTHHLMIEQCIRLTEEGGYMIFLIPNSLFTEPGAEYLRQLITEETYIQALLQLPESMFQEGSIYKSIFILQKKGEPIKKPKQTLMASLPTFSNHEKFTQTLTQINQWIENEKGEGYGKNPSN
jgi:site-specific DNA-methyltransferase (adenine-specific)